MDAVQSYEEAKDDETKREKMKYILDVFYGESSFYEIHGKKLEIESVSLDDLNPNAFKDVVAIIEQDLSRGLTIFWSSQLFKLFLKHKDGLSAALEQTTVLDSPAKEKNPQTGETSPRMMIREVYHTNDKVLLVANTDVGSQYTYKVTDAESKQIGWCRSANEYFVFHDMDENELRTVETGYLLGKKITNIKKTEEPVVVDDDVATSGCCRSRSSSATAPVVEKKKDVDDLNEPKWYFRASLNTPEAGPFTMKELQLLWRFHVVDEDFMLKSKNNPETRKFNEVPELFNPNKQLQLFDPTSIAHGTFKL